MSDLDCEVRNFALLPVDFSGRQYTPYIHQIIYLAEPDAGTIIA